MSTIAIYNLPPVGSELLDDSETYLEELSQVDIQIQGGFTSFNICSPLCLPPETLSIMPF